MGFIDELRWRDMIHDMTPGVEEFLNENKTSGYIGFDPTAPSLTIGNFVQIQLLTLLQKHGHRPIVLMGGATGRIGDPSFKSDERNLKSSTEIDENLKAQLKQLNKLLDFEEAENAAVLINNYDFYKEMNVLDFLRDVGKNLTVNYMMSKDSVKSRLETGLSFTEFSYQLLQANDYLQLYNKYACRLQLGGSDQWGNITSGTEFIRRNTEEGKAYAVTTPLLTKSDGSKFGKSESGNIWLDPEMTSPYKFYQFWINTDDANVKTYYKYFTLNNKEDAEEILDEYADNPRELKEILAKELTCRIHSEEDYEIASEVSEILFNHKLDPESLQEMKKGTLEKICQEIPSFEIKREDLDRKVSLVSLICNHTGIVRSNSALRRSIKSNALALNKEKVKDHNLLVDKNFLLHDRFLMVENGKKNKYVIEFV